VIFAAEEVLNGAPRLQLQAANLADNFAGKHGWGR
jgi:hypothetical protein